MERRPQKETSGQNGGGIEVHNMIYRCLGPAVFIHTHAHCNGVHLEFDI